MLSLKDNIWRDNLVDMKLISKCNKGFKFLCVINILVNMHGLLL